MLFSLFLYSCSLNESITEEAVAISCHHCPICTGCPIHVVPFLCFPIHINFKPHLIVEFLVIICNLLTMTHAKAEFSHFHKHSIWSNGGGWWHLEWTNFCCSYIAWLTQYWCWNPDFLRMWLFSHPHPWLPAGHKHLQFLSHLMLYSASRDTELVAHM